MDSKSLFSMAVQSYKSTDRAPSVVKFEQINTEIDIIWLLEKYRLFDHTVNNAKWQDQKEEFYKAIEVDFLLENMKQVKEEKTRICVENFLLRTFLANNDKILLLGQGALSMTKASVIRYLKTRLGKVLEEEESGGLASFHDTRSHYSTRHSGTSARSNRSRSIASRGRQSLTGTTTGKTEKSERKVNYMTKAALAHRENMSLSRRITRYEKECKETIENLRAKIVELDMRRREVYLAEDNFLMNFARTSDNLAFLREATEVQLINKFLKFITGIWKNAKSFKNCMHLTSDTMHNQSLQLYQSIIQRTDLHKTLTEPDNELLEIRLNEMLDEYQSKLKSSTEFQQITFIKSTELNKETRKFEADEIKYKQTLNQIESLYATIEHSKKELAFFTKNNHDALNKIEDLKVHLAQYRAPSVAEYMEVKLRYDKFVKEKKILMRQINLIKLGKMTKREKISVTNI